MKAASEDAPCSTRPRRMRSNSPLLQAAVDRAVERHNMTLRTPVGKARELVAFALGLVLELLAEGDSSLAAQVLEEEVLPESPDGEAATVSGCIGVALGLLDGWLSGTDASAPAGLGQRVRLPPGHWLGERAAADILVLARKGRAFAAADSLTVRQGGQHLLYGSALALTGAIQTWAREPGTAVDEPLSPASSPLR